MQINWQFNNPLAQLVLNNATPKIIYSIPTNVGVFGQIDSIVFCNVWTDSHITYWIALWSDAVNQDKQYMLYNMPLKANETFTAKIGTALRAGDKIFAFADASSDIAVNVYGNEESNRQ